MGYRNVFVFFLFFCDAMSWAVEERTSSTTANDKASLNKLARMALASSLLTLSVTSLFFPPLLFSSPHIPSRT